MGGRLVSLAIATLVSATLTLAQAGRGFQPYPGADASAPWFKKYAADTIASLRSIMPGAELEMWITSDAFDKVAAFYKARGDERPEFAKTLVENLRAKSGRPVQATHVVFDGASSPVTSKDYVSIQRPVIVQFTPLEVHDMTVLARYRMKK
jgi:hypothetical protein